MRKLLVDVVVPAYGKTYEFQLDGNLPAGTAKAYFAAYITQAESGAVAFSEQLILGDNTIQKRLDDNVTLRRAGVRGGHTLTLV